VVAYLALFVTLGGSAYAFGPGGRADSPRARAASETSVFGRFNNGPVTLSVEPKTVLSVRVPAGSYVILAKAVLPTSGIVVECRVTAGNDFDRAQLNGDGSGPLLGQQAFTLTVLHRSSSSFRARLRCGGDQGPNLRDLKLTAIRVNNLSNSPG
jgi:hypothetical protein